MIKRVLILCLLLSITVSNAAVVVTSPTKPTESQPQGVISHLDEKGIIGVTDKSTTLSQPIINNRPVNSNSSVINQDNGTLQKEASTQKVVMNNLNGIDNNTSDLNALKRKLEIEKAQADIKKISGGGSINSNTKGSGFIPDNAQTVVTGVAINQEGRKIAWLQFADGGALTVNIGSSVGKYTVSDISMSGVELSNITGKKGKAHRIFLKRAYFAPEKPKQSSNNVLGYTPSPIVTNANNDEMVPPIIPIR